MGIRLLSRVVSPAVAAALGVSLLVAIPQTATAAPPTISVGSGPRGVAIAPDESFALVANGAANNVSRVRLSDNAVVATISVGSAPWMMAINAAATHAYVANTSGNTVSRINLATNLVDATIAVGTAPRDLKISPDGSYAYVSNTGVSSLSRIRLSDNTVTTVNVGATPTSVDFAPDGSYVYVANAGTTTVSKVQTSDNTVVATINLGTGNNPTGVAIAPNGQYAYVAQTSAHTVARIRTSDSTVDSTLSLPSGSSPLWVDYTADGSSAFVANRDGNTVTRIDTATNKVVATFAVGTGPRSITAAPISSGLLFVPNSGSGTVSRIMTPTAPRITSITPGDASASVAFDLAGDQGLVMSNYEYSTDGGSTWAAPDPAIVASPMIVSGLANDASYQVRIRAVNQAGPGAASDAVSVTPVRQGPSISAIAASSGRPGASVTLTGDRFTGATSVTFGGKSAAFTVGSDESISAIVPLADAPGAVDVGVVTAEGTGTKAGGFTYTDPAPNETYCDNAPALINGDFETVYPEIVWRFYGGFASDPLNGPGWKRVPQGSAGVGWANTAVYLGEPDALELWKSTYNGVDAQSGQQIAEINAEVAGTLYQDIPTVPGETLRWSLWHHATPGTGDTNTMRVVIGAPGGDLVQSGANLVTGSTWTNYTGTYTVPAGQTTSRFAFEGVSPGGPYGNLLDNIVFTRDGCASAPVVTSVVPGPSSAKVTFTPGDDGGRPVRGYAYSVGGGEWVSVTPVNNSFTVPGLTNGASASIRVRAVTDATAGLPSAARSVTPTDVPPSPRSVAPAAGKVSWQAPDWAANDTLTTYTVVYKPWRQRNDAAVPWAVFARRTTPVTDALPLEVRMNATKGQCGAENVALGWTQCPLAPGALSSSETQGYAFRVFARTATKLGPMSEPVQYIKP